MVTRKGSWSHSSGNTTLLHDSSRFPGTQASLKAFGWASFGEFSLPTLSLSCLLSFCLHCCTFLGESKVFFFLYQTLSLGVGSQMWSAHVMLPPPLGFFPMWLLLMATWRGFINNTVNFAAFSPWTWHSFFLPFQPPVLWARKKFGSNLGKKKKADRQWLVSFGPKTPDQNGGCWRCLRLCGSLAVASLSGSATLGYRNFKWELTS